MRTTSISIAAICLLLAQPAQAAPLIDAPPPPLMPEAELEQDGTPKKPVLIETPSRGQLLYENHCTSCHESVAAIRTRHAVRSLPDLRGQIVRWADYGKLRWGKEDIDEVVRYLNVRHYRF
jgi:hypothetical protein